MRVRLIWLATLAGCVWMQLATSEQSDIGTDGAVWESFPPGQLLRILDRSIAASSTFNQTAVLAPTSAITRRADEPDEEHVSIKDRAYPTASREFDYDRAYEEFVQQYFSDSSSSVEKGATIENEDSSIARDDQSAEQQQNEDALYNSDQSESLEPQATLLVAKQKCKRVRGNGQVCVVCSNPKNYETSETCSYSKQSEPQNYIYEKQRSFKTHRGRNGAELESGEQPRSSKKREDESGENDDYAVQKPNRKRTISRENNISSCVKQIKDGKFCYSCQADDGAADSKCVEPAQPFSDGHNIRLGRRNTKKVHKTQQRIHKRTISYSIEKGSNGTAVQSELNENAGNATMGSPLTERVFIKFVKQKATLAH